LHRDPFDRLLVTADVQVAQYPVRWVMVGAGH
jgi:hypothetical protein